MTTDHATAGSATVDLPQGTLAYRAAGPATSAHPPVVLVHGLLVDARLWDQVAERLAAEGIRSYAPTLPLGSHQRPMNADADLSPQGIAQLALDFIRALDLSDVTIAGNDTGGAICQLMLGTDTSRIGAAVFTNCDAFGTFPPRALAPLFRALRHPGLVAGIAPTLIGQTGMRHGPLAYGLLASGPLDPALTRDWVRPLASTAIRRDLAKFARGVHPRVLLDAAGRLGQFTGPVRVLWGDGDPFFRLKLGRQLSEAFPRATLATVPGGRTFLPLDHARPGRQRDRGGGQGRAPGAPGGLTGRPRQPVGHSGSGSSTVARTRAAWPTGLGWPRKQGNSRPQVSARASGAIRRARDRERSTAARGYPAASQGRKYSSVRPPSSGPRGGRLACSAAVRRATSRLQNGCATAASPQSNGAPVAAKTLLGCRSAWSRLAGTPRSSSSAHHSRSRGTSARRASCSARVMPPGASITCSMAGSASSCSEPAGNAAEAQVGQAEGEQVGNARRQAELQLRVRGQHEVPGADVTGSASGARAASARRHG